MGVLEGAGVQVGWTVGIGVSVGTGVDVDGGGLLTTTCTLDSALLPWWSKTTTRRE